MHGFPLFVLNVIHLCHHTSLDVPTYSPSGKTIELSAVGTEADCLDNGWPQFRG